MGCDSVLESGAQRDNCGVCNGDNSGATLVTDTLTGSGGFGYHKVGKIPAGASNVRIAEQTPTSLVYLGKVICTYIHDVCICICVHLKVNNKLIIHM